ncbi:MAG: glycosyltransferase family 39 protein [Chloroflexi bacterium]|nr:glycosyltransferase family 39 protein [Chloroflexota bacterium]
MASPAARLQLTVVALLALLALLRGGIYAVSFPAFEGPDENAHYEYVRLVYETGRWPSLTDTSPVLREQVTTYMRERGYGLYRRGANNRPELIFSTEITRQPPAYYVLAALSQVPLGDVSLPVQVVAMRLVSVLLTAGTVVLSFLLAHELFPRDRLLWLGVPLVVTLVPGFTFVGAMTNNDGLAAFGVTLVLYLGVVILQRGITRGRAFAIIAAVALALLSKRTAIHALPLALFVIPLYYGIPGLRGHARSLRRFALTLVVGIAALLAIGSLAITFDGDAAEWTKVGMTSRSASAEAASLGQHSLRVAGDVPTEWGGLIQSVSPEEVMRLRGRTVTVGAWARASNSASAPGGFAIGDSVNGAQSEVGVPLTAGPEWTFHRVHKTVEPAATELYVRLQAEPGAQVLFDGVVLVEGLIAPNAGLPQARDTGAASVVWGGRELISLVRDGSGEERLPRLRHRVARTLQTMRLDPGIVAAMLDPTNYAPGLRARWPELLRFAFESFWGNFGWLNVPLGSTWYNAALALLLPGLAGLVLFTWRQLRPSDELGSGQRKSLALLAAAACLTFVVGLLPFLANAFPGELPQGRYLYTGIVPFAVFVMLGYRQIVPERWTRLSLFGLLLALVAFDGLALATYVLPRYFAV